MGHYAGRPWRGGPLTKGGSCLGPAPHIIQHTHHCATHTPHPMPAPDMLHNSHCTQTCSTTHTAPSIDRTTHIPSHATQPFKTTTSAQSSTDSSVPPGDVVTVSPTSPTTACYITLQVNEELHICFLVDTGSCYLIL